GIIRMSNLPMLIITLANGSFLSRTRHQMLFRFTSLSFWWLHLGRIVKAMSPGLKGFKGLKENTCIAATTSMEGTCMAKMSLLLAVEILAWR
ncbi:hypothetical protein VIGAN_02146500, partial [Vigna angularis var. angularis]